MKVVIAAFVHRHETAGGVFTVTGSETSRVGGGGGGEEDVRSSRTQRRQALYD